MTEREELIKQLRDTASKGVSVWGDLQIAAANMLEADGKQEPVAHAWVRPLQPDESQRLVTVKWVGDPVAGPLYTAPVAQKPPLTDDQIEALGHRIATKYTHRSDPASHSYGFVRHTLIDFARAIEKHGIGGGE